MMRLHLSLFALGALVGATPAAALSPPIACRTATSEVERTICATPEYAAMDREIAALYDRSLAVGGPDARQQLVDHQRAFLKKRQGCAWAAHHSAHPGPAIDECLRATMEARVATLRRFVGSGGR